MNFHSFSSKIALLVSGLLTVTLVITFILVNRENTNNALRNVAADLITTEEAFTSLLESRTTGLFDVVRPATSDHAFRTTFIDGHIPTLESAMQNLLNRIRYVSTDLMLLTDLNLNTIAQASPDSIRMQDLPVEQLVNKAFGGEEYESSGIISTPDQPYQLIASPLLIPNPQGWIFVGFPIGDQFVQSTKEITQTDVSIAIFDGVWRLSSTTLNTEQQSSFTALLPSMLDEDNLSIETMLNGVPFLSRLQRLDSDSDAQVYVGLHGNLDQAIAPYQRLNRSLYAIFGGGLLLSAFAAITLARSVSAPVKALTKGVEAIRSGDLSRRVQSKSSGEIGHLGSAFNEMAEGLQEKEQVRNLLGKVVSEEIASELLTNQIELGGEEKEITVLFCDIRNFTAICEAIAPQKVLTRLNSFFSEASKIIESHQGVIDKYMGDALMALFGAPIKHGNEENRAVGVALEMREKIHHAMTEQDQLEEPLKFGIGIASGQTLVGNMGSENRLNYSVIGDGVNVAARLESLTKFYEIPVLVNERVAINANQYTFRWIDRIRAKGKRQAIDIYQPLQAHDIEAKQDLLQLHQSSVKAYLAAEWDEAEKGFSLLKDQCGNQKIYQIYLDRIQGCREKGLTDWDGTFTHTTK